MKTTLRLLPAGRTAGLIAALTMTAAVAACSSSANDSATDGGSDSGQVDVAEAAQGESLNLSGAPGAGSVLDADNAKATTTGVSALRERAVERHVISHGTVSLISDDVAAARRDVQRIVDQQDATITQEKTETDDEGDATYARLVIRVPASSFTETMLALEKSGDLRKSQQTSEDVTTEVIDTDVRVRAQEGSLRRVEQLLARASSLKEIIWIESQLTSRQADLDSLKSQQAWLADQTSESTITLDIERRPEPAAKEKNDKDASGFLIGLTGGTKALGAFASTLATIVGALLPFAIVLAVFGVPLWLLVRRSVRRQAKPTAAG